MEIKVLLSVKLWKKSMLECPSAFLNKVHFISFVHKCSAFLCNFLGDAGRTLRPQNVKIICQYWTERLNHSLVKM